MQIRRSNDAAYTGWLGWLCEVVAGNQLEMNLLRWSVGLLLGVALIEVVIVSPAIAGIVDFNEWTLVEDPPNANFASSVDSSSQISLNAITGPIPSGTDIGYQSVNGPDAANSTAGWGFDPAFDFSVAMDFDLSFGSPSGGFSIGMGIGEDRDGTDSAGVVLLTEDGGALAFAGAARINDISQTPVMIGVPAQNQGRFIVSYSAGSGDVTLGVSTDGDDVPEGTTGTFGGIQKSWDDEVLLISLFARGDHGILPWNSGSANAVITDFHVITGMPQAIPESSSVAFLVLSSALLVAWRRSKHNLPFD